MKCWYDYQRNIEPKLKFIGLIAVVNKFKNNSISESSLYEEYLNNYNKDQLSSSTSIKTNLRNMGVHIQL